MSAPPKLCWPYRHYTWCEIVLQHPSKSCKFFNCVISSYVPLLIVRSTNFTLLWKRGGKIVVFVCLFFLEIFVGKAKVFLTVAVAFIMKPVWYVQWICDHSTILTAKFDRASNRAWEKYFPIYAVLSTIFVFQYCLPSSDTVKQFVLSDDQSFIIFKDYNS